MTEMLPVITFSKRDGAMPMPHLLDIQTEAFKSLLVPDDVEGHRQDVSLERVFRDLFPISDVNNKYSLEYVSYTLGEAKYTVEECIERDMTYAAPLKAKLRLIITEEVEGVRRMKDAIEKEVYLGELPMMTPLGTFVINGAERVVVSQLHRSPGVVFEEDTHPNGQRLFSARIIPFRGSWVEFTHRHPRCDLRPHRQEEEVPGHGPAARLRVRRERRRAAALLRQQAAGHHRQARGRARSAGRSSGALLAADVRRSRGQGRRAAGHAWAMSSPPSG